MTARILIIEDNQANLDLMQYLLEAFGYTVITAMDGKQGIDTAFSEQPDLIICDLQLPVMSGYQVIGELRTQGNLVNIPVLAVTAFAMEDDRKKTLAAGFDGYFTKPITPETFVQDIEAFLPPDLRNTIKPSQAVAEAGLQQEHIPYTHTILVVDDRPVNLEFAINLLGYSGYRVITASNLEQAIMCIRADRPDLVLSDVCMQDASGFDFIKTVKADPDLNSIPFIFITSTHTSEKYRDEGIALGAVAFLFRPIDPEKITDEINKCLRKNMEDDHDQNTGC